jgi:hypothetical protein
MHTPGEGGTRRRIAFWIVAAVTLVVGHDLVFAVQLGPGRGLTEALRSAGHAYLPLGTTLVAAAGILLCSLWLVRLRRMASLGAAGHRSASEDPGAPFRRSLALVARLFAVVALAFLVMENVEHFVSHGHLPGLGALLGPEYPLAIPVLLAASVVGAFLAGLVRERERALLARIAGHAAPRRPSSGYRNLCARGFCEISAAMLRAGTRSSMRDWRSPRRVRKKHAAAHVRTQGRWKPSVPHEWAAVNCMHGCVQIRIGNDP